MNLDEGRWLVKVEHGVRAGTIRTFDNYKTARRYQDRVDNEYGAICSVKVWVPNEK